MKIVKLQFLFQFFMIILQNIAKCDYNGVQYDMLLLKTLQWKNQIINQSLKSQKMSNILPWGVSYRLFLVWVFDKIDCVIMATHCKTLLQT